MLHENEKNFIEASAYVEAAMNKLSSCIAEAELLYPRKICARIAEARLLLDEADRRASLIVFNSEEE